MVRLMKLELKKIHFLRYLLMSAAALLLAMFFVFVALNDSGSQKDTFDSAFRAVQMIFVFVYVIFFAVLVSALVISEYNNKTILLMFTYPLDRKKLMASKLLLITLFMASSILAGYVCCALFLVGVDRRLDLIAGEFSAEVLQSWISAALSSTVVFCCLGLWSFAAGMLRKSVTVTIVSSMVFIFLRQVVVSASVNYRESIRVVLAAVVITLLALWYTFRRKLTQID
ncbi:MAG: ABC transporter permease [Roseburia sp.]|nr:ABC transporter permease [Roseburia sp.]MCM1097999.1 ABC transporter permease [Ruminococcus flavefaciens]